MTDAVSPPYSLPSSLLEEGGLASYTAEANGYKPVSDFDRDASARLTEYETAKAHHNVLARLVPSDVERQETHLLGGHDEDADYIRSFEFDDDPGDVFGEAIEWAERVVEDRRESYRTRLPGHDA
jgi:hypothetical protein